MDDRLKIDGVERVASHFGQVDPRGKRRKQDKRRGDESRKHFQELTKKAEDVHAILIQEKSPYRFCVYQEGEDIFIDVVIVDADGQIKETFKKNITHDEFMSWVRHIEAGSGLIIDHEV